MTGLFAKFSNGKDIYYYQVTQVLSLLLIKAMRRFESYDEKDAERPFETTNTSMPISDRICIYDAKRPGRSTWDYIMNTFIISKTEDVQTAKREFLQEIHIFRQAQSHHVVKVSHAFELSSEGVKNIELAIVMPTRIWI